MVRAARLIRLEARRHGRSGVRTAEFAEPVLRMLNVAPHERDRELDAVGVTVLREMQADHDALLRPN